MWGAHLLLGGRGRRQRPLLYLSNSVQIYFSTSRYVTLSHLHCLRIG